MAGISFVKVIDAGPRYTKVLADDGKTYTLKGDRNWRNNNPGNIEYGDFAKSLGAIGSDGRFAVFPSIDHGYAAQETLQFEGKSYRDKSIGDAISRYAPEFENDSAAYAAEVAAAAGVPVTTKMSDLSPDQRKAFLAAQHRVEGMKPGTIMGAEGEPVAPEVAEQFAAARLPPGSIPNGKADHGGVSAYQQQLAQRGFDPGPIDGKKGPRTTAAIKAFQKANNLVDDGVVGPKTMAALQGQERPHTLQPPPGWARQPANTLGPAPMIPNEDMPERAAFWQEAGGPQQGFRALPAPAPLVAPPYTGNTLGAAPTAPALGSNVPLPRERPAPPGPAPLAAPEAPAAPSGGFDLGSMLGGIGNTLGQTAQNIGTTLGNTATNVVEGTKKVAANTADAVKDTLTNELIGTVKGRTLLLNTALGLPAPGTHDPLRYGATTEERQENARRRQAMADGVPYVPNNTAVKSEISVPQPKTGTGNMFTAKSGKQFQIGRTYQSSRGPVQVTQNGFQLISGPKPATATITPRPSGRTIASRGETAEGVWAEAKGY